MGTVISHYPDSEHHRHGVRDQPTQQAAGPPHVYCKEGAEEVQHHAEAEEAVFPAEVLPAWEDPVLRPADSPQGNRTYQVPADTTEGMKILQGEKKKTILRKR